MDLALKKSNILYYIEVFYMMGKGLYGELSFMWTGLVFISPRIPVQDLAVILHGIIDKCVLYCLMPKNILKNS